MKSISFLLASLSALAIGCTAAPDQPATQQSPSPYAQVGTAPGAETPQPSDSAVATTIPPGPAPVVPGAPDPGGGSSPATPPLRPAAPPTAPAPSGGNGTGEVTARAAAVGSSPVYVDVRTPQEYQAGHVQGAVLIPVDQLAQRASELEQFGGRPIVLYCRTGHRAGIALDVLRSKGFTNVENGGGLDGLAARGLPVVR